MDNIAEVMGVIFYDDEDCWYNAREGLFLDKDLNKSLKMLNINTGETSNDN